MNAGARAGPRLRLLPIDDGHVQALCEGADAFERSTGVCALDADTLLRDMVEPLSAQLVRIPCDSPFVGFLCEELAAREIVGMCGFKTGPVDGAVEIAYGNVPAREGRGIATSMLRELVQMARRSGAVTRVIAHTLARRNASTSVLETLGFEHRGLVEDLEDGPVWRRVLPISG